MSQHSATTTRADAGGHSGVFLSFFYRLRGRGLRVTPQQWLTVVEGLAGGLHGSSLAGFYSLSRGIMVKDEAELDDFDLAFAEHFEGIEAAAAVIGAPLIGPAPGVPRRPGDPWCCTPQW